MKNEGMAEHGNPMLGGDLVTGNLSKHCLISDIKRGSAGCHHESIKSFEVRQIDAQSLFKSTVQPMSVTQRAGKEAFDRITATVLLIILSPPLLMICAIIRYDSRGPVLFRQPRIGLNGRLFTCLKFRTMHHHATDLLADRQTSRNDPRITRIGRWLRCFSLDELPQLFNVIGGQMSLVGPRPHAPNTKAAGQLFTEASPDYAKRQRIRPGITGWAQVNGWRGETATLHQLERRIEHDLYYIEHWSFTLDIYILLKTITHGFKGPQAF